ncbi:MAG: hypothetical protein MI919_19755, partial [Holophagales bacterium]|nr:hypothetical protein [Holophagales bacterium]
RTDTRLTGVMTVSPFAPLGFTQMAISANGETVTRPMVIVDWPDAPAAEANLLAGTAVEAKALASGSPAPRLMMQGIEIDPNLATAYALAERKAKALGWCASFYVSWSHAYNVSFELVLFDIDTGEIGEIAAILGIGDQLNIGTYTIAVRLQFALHFQWTWCSTTGWWPPLICLEVLVESEVPGGNYTYTYSVCYDRDFGGSGPSSGSTNRADLQGGPCAEVTNFSTDQGVGQSTITQTDCCTQQIGAELEGESFGNPYYLEFPDAGETESDPECTNLDCRDITLAINSVDARFAPGTERLDLTYTMNPPDGEHAYGVLEVYAHGDDQNPVFQDDTLRMGANVAYMQGGAQLGWDGESSAGELIGPSGSPYTVKITTSLSPDFTDACTTSATFRVDVHSISVSPFSDRELFKPSGATEINELVTATVLLKKKDGSGAPVQSEIEVEWSFEDPDDASNRSGVDPNGRAGDDNAPLANGGKRIIPNTGQFSTMWWPMFGSSMTLGLEGQTAVTKVPADGITGGETSVRFSASVIAGDNYIVKAKVANLPGGALYESRTGTWTVRKRLDFDRGFQMTGGTNISNTMSNGRVRHRALTKDAHTDYYWGGNVINLSDSPEYLSELRAPKVCVESNPAADCETPTNQEDEDYHGDDPALQAAAKAAITAKAQRWYVRSEVLAAEALAEFSRVHNIPRRSAVGARYYHPKFDGRPNTGSTDYYPSDILITTRTGSRVDPDAPGWLKYDGMEADDIAWIFKNNADRTRTARHEVGHSSDHHSFGPGDHSPDPSDVMYFAATHNTFRDTSILRLRGWAP